MADCPKDCIVLIVDMFRLTLTSIHSLQLYQSEMTVQILKKLNRQSLNELSVGFIQWIQQEQERRTVARKKAQQAKAMKKGSQKR